jgi:hypothetical protein
MRQYPKRHKAHLGLSNGLISIILLNKRGSNVLIA